MISAFFINRPVLANVLAIITTTARVVIAATSERFTSCTFMRPRIGMMLRSMLPW